MPTLRALALAATATLAAGQAIAQAMPGMATPTPARTVPAAAAAQSAHDMAGMDMGGTTAMPAFFGAYPMAREASGTSWQPEVGADGLAMSSAGPWMLMGHADLNLVYNAQGGPRGDDKAFVAGMVMGMASRDLGPGRLGLRVMVSPDPFMGASGYPLLLADGETADGKTPLLDRQHPHDLVAELAASYSLPLGPRDSAFLYLAPVGEPALGPPAFMHRSSGMDSPEAPITHHWLDSTHISYGVVTGGWVHDGVKLELSGFRGREPDQHRYDIEAPKLDSVAVRATWNPSPSWSMQASYGRLTSPEQLEPHADEDRVTASLAYARPVSQAGTLSATVAWGRKVEREPGRADADLDGALAEAELMLDPRWTLFGRAEWKRDNELAPGATHGGAAPIYDVGKVSAGAIRDWAVRPHMRLGLGGLLSVYGAPGVLGYGGTPVGGMLFLRMKAG